MTTQHTTATDIRLWIDEGSFYDRLMEQTTIDVGKGPSGKVILHLSLPEWFSRLLTKKTQDTIKQRMLDHAQEAYETSSQTGPM